MPTPERAPDQLCNEDLLAILLRSKRNAAEIAEHFSLVDLSDSARGELGISEVAYSRLMAAIELGRRVAEAKRSDVEPTKLCSTDATIEFFRVRFARLITDGKREEFHVVTLDTKNQFINSHCVSAGTLDASLVHPREVFRPAIKDVASSIILAHNHPSGDPKPSKEDFEITERLKEVGKLIGIEVLDHIVMGKYGVVSVKAWSANA